ncbi:MAG: hypothetical protein R3E95_12170 [Thiolinea sp.]
MARQSATTFNKIARQSGELALATPMVMAHRLTRMALAGPQPSKRDQKEFYTMGAEKVTAFSQAWTDMKLQARTGEAQQKMAQSMLSTWMQPWWLGNSKQSSTLQNAMLDVWSKGLNPVHKRATANARRLSRTRLK